jgi:hypothetical protein
MSGSGAVKRFVFKELKSGDLRKFNATSADSKSGGGARDQRFSPYGKFDAVFHAMFKGTPEHRNRKKKDGTTEQLTIYVSPIAVHADDTHRSNPAKEVQHESQPYLVQTLRYWPPTEVRANEGRLGEVSKLDLAPPSDKGRVFLLIFEDDTALTPRVAFVTEHDVKAKSWEKSINDFFEKLLETPATTNAVMGYKDFVNKTSWTKES